MKQTIPTVPAINLIAGTVGIVCFILVLQTFDANYSYRLPAWFTASAISATDCYYLAG